MLRGLYGVTVDFCTIVSITITSILSGSTHHAAGQSSASDGFHETSIFAGHGSTLRRPEELSSREALSDAAN
jgi:hypothetical protein